VNIKVLERDGRECWIPGDVVRYFFPRINGDTADYVLWNMTAYPMGGAETTRDQLAVLAALVRPRKRGWLRRLWREARQQDFELLGVK
jgi:hypothetical protein